MAVRELVGGDRPTLLYVHGLGESALCFEPLMADSRLQPWPQLAVDLEGYGKSGWAREPLSLDEHADRLGDLIESRSLSSVIVIGHSMGGVIGTLLGEKSPAVRGFLNVEGNISLGDCGYSSKAVRFSGEDWLSHGFDEVLDVIYTDTVESPAVNRAYGASIQMCDPRAYHLNSEELVSFSRAETLAGRLAALDVRTRYLHGAPRGTGERSLELLAAAGIETVAVEGAGHWPFLDRPEAFTEALHDFLVSCE